MDYSFCFESFGGITKNLALELRPNSFNGVLGMPEIISAIKKQLESERIPNVWLFTGGAGTGKTTLSYIISQEIQKGTGQAEIDEINCADSTGVDKMRYQIERSRYNPMTGLYRCVILNEAQKLTDAAQQALLVPLEDITSSTIWFLTTTDPSKINEALLSRCGAATYKLKGLDYDGRLELIQKALYATKTDNHYQPILKAIELANITSGRDIINVVEMYANGMPPEEAVQSADANPEYVKLAQFVLATQWNNLSSLLKKLKPADAKPFRSVLSGLARNSLLTGNTGCVTLLKELALYQAYEQGIDLSALFAIIYSYCHKTGGK